jgi:hypothetical protein
MVFSQSVRGKRNEWFIEKKMVALAGVDGLVKRIYPTGQQSGRWGSACAVSYETTCYEKLTDTDQLQ